MDDRVRSLEQGAARTDALMTSLHKDIERLQATVDALQTRVNRFIMGLLWLLLGGAGGLFTFMLQKFMG